MSLFFASSITALLLSCMVRFSNSYCSSPGANPGFRAGPKVEQVSLTSVLVSWEGLVKQVDCADQFIVKSWSRNDPSSYKLSDMVPTSTYSLQVKELTPHRSYAFQAIAREDKGWLGADWNKSPVVYFTTKRHNPTVAPHKDVKHPIVDIAKHNSWVEKELEERERRKNPGKVKPLSEEEDTKGPLNFIVIVGIVLAGLMVVLIAVGVMYNITKKKKDFDEEDDASDSDQSSTDSLQLENYSHRGTGKRDMTYSSDRRY